MLDLVLFWFHSRFHSPTSPKQYLPHHMYDIHTSMRNDKKIHKCMKMQKRFLLFARSLLSYQKQHRQQTKSKICGEISTRLEGIEEMVEKHFLNFSFIIWHEHGIVGEKISNLLGKLHFCSSLVWFTRLLLLGVFPHIQFHFPIHVRSQVELKM